MKRKWWVVASILAVIGVLWILTRGTDDFATLASALGIKPASVEGSKSKPVCDSPVNPNVAAPTDCIPPHLANLPPDPGEAGKLTIDGIDSDKDGIRDDVQRWIAQNWGHSPLAVKGLTLLAQVKQIEVHYGDELGKAKTREQFGPETERKIICFNRLETTAMLEGRAADKLANVVTNTPERWKRSRDFDYMFAHGIYPSPNLTTNEACGFDADALAVQTGEQTISSQLRAESIERTKREEREERERAIKEEGK